MSNFKFKEPTCRKRRPPRQPPFPVPVGSISGEPSSGDTWSYFLGCLVGNAVVVSHSGDMDSLYKMGCFGKASLSRFCPEYNHGFKGIGRKRPSARTNQDRTTQEMLRVTSRRKYMRHLHWKQLQDRGTSEEMTEDLEILPLPEPRTRLYKQPLIGEVGKVKEKDSSNCESDLQAQPSHSQEGSLGGFPEGPEGQSWPTSDPWAESDHDPWADDDPLMSEAFWTNEEPGNKPPQEEKCVGAEVKDDRLRDQVMLNVQEQNMSDAVTESYTAKNQRTKKRLRQSRSDLCSKSSNNPSTSHEEPQKSEIDACGDITMEDNEPSSDFATDTNMEVTAAGSWEHTQAFDPRSLEDDPAAQLLIVDDSDDGEDGWDVPGRLSWRPVAKKDPYPLKEHLHLALEEAFFLTFALGCLIVTDENGVPLNLTQMWKRFIKCRPLFPYQYAVYHNLRSKGWVPKQGFKYGVDYVVYKEGPSYYHSSFCAQIRVVEQESLQEIKELNERQLTWSALAGLNRVTEQVAKEVMICYVLKPRTLTHEELQSPDCIKRLKIQETILQRWISSQERESCDQT